MKLASLKTPYSRDGKLCLVSRNLTHILPVADVAATMQIAIENWGAVKKELQARYDELNQGGISDASPYDPDELSSPFPRAYQWADGSAYVNHVELVRKARGATMPENFWSDPLIYQGGSDDFLGPTDPIMVADESYGIDFEAEIAVVTSDVNMGADVDAAADSICLLMLVNDVSLRNLIPNELSKGFGFFQSKPSSSFSPVAVTPDELGNAWNGQKVSLPLTSHLNNKKFGEPNAGQDMTFSFPELISHAAKTRILRAGTIIGSGTVSNTDRSKGSSCIAEKRMLEILETGAPKTPFMKFGDRIKIEMKDDSHASIFGAIDQIVLNANEQPSFDRMKDNSETI